MGIGLSWKSWVLIYFLQELSDIHASICVTIWENPVEGGITKI